MNSHLKDIEFLSPPDFDLNCFTQIEKEEPFSENSISFLNALSILLRNDPESNDFPELASLAFFFRKANLIHLKEIYYPHNGLRIGKGIVFHITPSNVPVNFAYSLGAGILSGNLNIVRLPSKKFKQVDIVLKAIQALGESREFQLFSRRMLLVRYDKLISATAYFSSLCDVRLIWGGDIAIEEIKKNNLPPKATDVTFADKYSICIINADKYKEERSPEKIAHAFYNDTFLFDQNACTSPHLIVWMGSDEHVSESQQIFWDHLHDLVKKRYDFQPLSAVNKLAAFCNQAIHLGEIRKTSMPDNLIWRTEIKELSEDLDKYRGNCGYFVEYKAASLLELSRIISEKHQTIACYGVQKEDWTQFNAQNNLDVMDRIRPVGKTSDFSLTWDGYNLIDTLSMQSIMNPDKQKNVKKT
jgi:hypothetical protein